MELNRVHSSKVERVAHNHSVLSSNLSGPNEGQRVICSAHKINNRLPVKANDTAWSVVYLRDRAVPGSNPGWPIEPVTGLTKDTEAPQTDVGICSPNSYLSKVESDCVQQSHLAGPSDKDHIGARSHWMASSKATMTSFRDRRLAVKLWALGAQTSSSNLDDPNCPAGGVKYPVCVSDSQTPCESTRSITPHRELASLTTCFHSCSYGADIPTSMSRSVTQFPCASHSSVLWCSGQSYEPLDHNSTPVLDKKTCHQLRAIESVKQVSPTTPHSYCCEEKAQDRGSNPRKTISVGRGSDRYTSSRVMCYNSEPRSARKCSNTGSVKCLTPKNHTLSHSFRHLTDPISATQEEGIMPKPLGGAV